MAYKGSSSAGDDALKKQHRTQLTPESKDALSIIGIFLTTRRYILWIQSEPVLKSGIHCNKRHYFDAFFYSKKSNQILQKAPKILKYRPRDCNWLSLFQSDSGHSFREQQAAWGVYLGLLFVAGDFIMIKAVKNPISRTTDHHAQKSQAKIVG